MPALHNRTPFAAVDFFSVDRDARELLVLCVAGTFDLRRATSVDLVPPIADEQLPPTLAEEWSAEPGASSLRRDSQAVYTRPGTDVVVWGHAVGPRGRPVAQQPVSLRAGPLVRRALVSGTRVWRRGAHGLSPSDPVPFESMPLVYERAFGGVAAQAPSPAGAPAAPSPAAPRTPAFCAQNPIGIGYYTSEREALDHPLPALEDEAALIRTPLDHPAPFGFGPLPRHFQPRAGYAGTCDDHWRETRAPLWPTDLDERFFQGAPPGAVATPHLRGGEPVVLEGTTPDGPLAFTLPPHRLAARITLRGKRESRALRLDAVTIDADERRLTLIWRAAFPAHRALAHLTETLVRWARPEDTA
jgi:hypothetical protein